MNQTNLQIPNRDTSDLRERTVSLWALKDGRKAWRWGEKRVAGDKDRKGEFVRVFAYVSFGASPGLSTLFSARPKPISSALWACMVSAGTAADRQLLLNPDCFRFTGCERVWLRGCDPSEGGLSPPLLLPLLTSLLLEGGRRLLGRRGLELGWGVCRHHVTHVSCWADQNGIWTKTHHLLLPASGCPCVT